MKPIDLNTAQVRALLDGHTIEFGADIGTHRIGERFWVREGFIQQTHRIIYAADLTKPESVEGKRQIPGVMLRSQSRMTVQVERLEMRRGEDGQWREAVTMARVKKHD